MDFKGMSNNAVLTEIGERINRQRLNQNISQIDLSQRAGVTRIVVQRLENGLGCTLKSMVKILRALDHLDKLDSFLPESSISPIQLAKLKGKERERASRPRRK